MEIKIMEKLLKTILNEESWEDYLIENLTVEQLERLNKILENKN